MSGLRIENFLKNLENEIDIQNICISEKNYIDTYYLTISSRKKTYSIYRKAVNDSKFSMDIKKIILNTLRLSNEEMLKYKKDYKEKVKSEHDNLRYINDVQGYIETAIYLLQSKNFIDKVLGFAAITGRRVAEIGSTAEFELHTPQHLIFKGQLKTKESNYYDSYIIPILMNTYDFITHFRFFREQYTKYLNNPDAFHNSCSKDLSFKVKVHFSKFVEGVITPKNLRAIYATIVSNEFNKNTRKTHQSYIADILGHSPDDLNTVNSYFVFKLKE